MVAGGMVAGGMVPSAGGVVAFGSTGMVVAGGVVDMVSADGAVVMVSVGAVVAEVSAAVPSSVWFRWQAESDAAITTAVTPMLRMRSFIRIWLPWRLSPTLANYGCSPTVPEVVITLFRNRPGVRAPARPVDEPGLAGL